MRQHHGVCLPWRLAPDFLAVVPPSPVGEVRAGRLRRRARLRRVVGGPDVMRAQLHRLVEASELPNVVVRALPFEAGAHPGVDGSFTVLEFPDPGDPRIVYLDWMTDSDFLDGLRDIAAYRYTHERLRAVALPPNDSREMISRLVED